MRAKSIKGRSLQEIQVTILESIADGFKPTLAVVFISVKQDLAAVSGFLDEQGVVIFGATTAGEFIDGDFSQGSIAIMLMDLDPSSFKVLFDDVSQKDTQDAAGKLAALAQETFTRPAHLVSGSGLIIDGEMIIRGMEAIVGGDAIIWGGMAGDDSLNTATYVFTNGKSSDQGIVMLVLDSDRVTLVGRASSGWRGVGTVKTITKSNGMWIEEIDGRPALEQLTKYLGLSFIDKEHIIETINSSAVNSFLELKDAGEPVLRSTLTVNPDSGSVKVTAHVKPGAKIRIAMPPEYEIIDDVIRSFQKVKDNVLTDFDALIMFSCNGRVFHFGPLIGKEIQALKETFNAPLVGFFTYGEFGRAVNGNNEFHNLTCCWVGLKEKERHQ